MERSQPPSSNPNHAATSKLPEVKKWHTIQHPVSHQFCDLARRLNLSPERLAKILCDDFARKPVPKELVIVSYASDFGKRPASRSSGASAALPQK